MSKSKEKNEWSKNTIIIILGIGLLVLGILYIALALEIRGYTIRVIETCTNDTYYYEVCGKTMPDSFYNNITFDFSK